MGNAEFREVKELEALPGSAAHLWLTDKVFDELARSGNGPFVKTLARMLKNGLVLYEMGEPPKVKHEWDGVYRIGIRSSLFRLIGFYEDGTNKTHFICPDCFDKGGQQLNAAQRQRINVVARIKSENLWRKVNDGKYPRLVGFN